MSEKFDVIVVGAGPAGSSAAYKLAQSGAEVLLVERGPYPGAKNLSGGVLFGRVLVDLIPEFWNEAPIERYINRNILTLMTEDATLNIDFRNEAFSTPPYNGFSVLRGKFDAWLAEKAEEAGAALITGIKVDAPLIENGAIKGILAGEDELLADVVIAGDGALSTLAQQAGLRDQPQPSAMAVGVKELIGLNRSIIEERFGLTGNEGTAYGMIGYPTRGVPGGAFFYTNLDSISVGLVMHIDHCSEHKVSPADALEEFLAHPFIAPLIRGGQVLEYGAHMVPEGGINGVPKLYTDGMLVVGDAAGLGSNNGFAVRGMDYAIASGIYAADTIITAKEKGDFTAATLSQYEQMLENSFVLQDMKTYAGAGPLMKTQRIYNEYPQMAADVLDQVYTQQSLPKENLLKILMQARKDSKVSFLNLGKDGWKAVKSL